MLYESLLWLALVVAACWITGLLRDRKKYSLKNFRLVEISCREGEELNPTKSEMNREMHLVDLRDISEVVDNAKKNRGLFSYARVHVWRIKVMRPVYKGYADRIGWAEESEWHALADYVAWIRAELGLSQDQFGVFIGPQPCSWEGWVKGTNVQAGDWDHVRRIHDFLKTGANQAECKFSSLYDALSATGSAGRRNVDALRLSDADAEAVYAAVFPRWQAPGGTQH